MRKWVLSVMTVLTMLVLIALTWWVVLPNVQKNQQLSAQVTGNSSGVTKLYDEVLSLPGCGLSGSNSCSRVDGTPSSQVMKTFRFERYVPASGFLGVYFRDLNPGVGSVKGGLNASSFQFEKSNGELLSLARGAQVFERGRVLIQFDQPYTDQQRLESSYEIVIYYLSHSKDQRDSFLTTIRTEQEQFEDYKQQNAQNIDELCQALASDRRPPLVCPQSAGLSSVNGSSQQPGVGPTGGVSNPSALPELDFSGKALRVPEITINNPLRLTFVGEPVTIKLDQVMDPDGKCRFFQFQWQKPTSLSVSDFQIDDLHGDLFFRPQNTGSFTLRVRAKEVCGSELGNLTSGAALIRLVVRDKQTDFQDLAQVPGFQNYIYDLYHLGAMQGYPDGSIQPTRRINRAEFLKLVFATLNYQIDMRAYSARYPDVLPSDWFAPYVFEADRLGVVKGYPDGKFHPERTINLAEALKIAMHFTDLEIKDSLEYIFGDFDYRDWFSRYIQTAYREGILEDITPGKNVYPDQPITRARAAYIIVRTLLFPVNHINYTNADVMRRADEFEDFSSFDYKVENSLK